MPDPQIPTDQDISNAAFFLWLDEGKPEGRAEAHWHRAKEMLTRTDTEAALQTPAKKRNSRAKNSPAEVTEKAAPAKKPRKPKAPA